MTTRFFLIGGDGQILDVIPFTEVNPIECPLGTTLVDEYEYDATLEVEYGYVVECEEECT